MRQAFMSDQRNVFTEPKDIALRANVELGNPGTCRRR
jgi:hypothetical protein